MRKEQIRILTAACIIASGIMGGCTPAPSPAQTESAAESQITETVEESPADETNPESTTDETVQESTAAGASAETSAEEETPAESPAAEGTETGETESRVTRLKQSVESFRKEIPGLWGPDFEMNYSDSKNTVVISLFQKTLSQDALLKLPKEEWDTICGQVREVSDRFMSRLDEAGLGETRLNVELVESQNRSLAYLIMENGKVSYDVWPDLTALKASMEAAAEAEKAAADETTASEDAASETGSEESSGTETESAESAGAETENTGGTGTGSEAETETAAETEAEAAAETAAQGGPQTDTKPGTESNPGVIYMETAAGPESAED